jgi:hypothetical protein
MILIPALIVLSALVVVGVAFIVVASVGHWIAVRQSRNRSHRGLCPRCGRNLLEGKDHCSECGMIIPRKASQRAGADSSAGMAKVDVNAAGISGGAESQPALIETALPSEARAFAADDDDGVVDAGAILSDAILEIRPVQGAGALRVQLPNVHREGVGGNGPVAGGFSDAARPDVTRPDVARPDVTRSDVTRSGGERAGLGGEGLAGDPAFTGDQTIVGDES